MADDLAVAEHGEAVAHLRHLVEVMGDINDGNALLFQCMDKFKENVFFLFGKDGGRLVEDEDFAVLGQRAQNGDDLALHGRHQIDGLLHVDIKGVAADQIKR